MNLPTNILPDLLFVQSNGADAIPFRPKMSAPITSFQLMMHIEYFDCALAFKNPIASDMEYFGGMDKTRWIWSTWMFPSRMSIFLHSHNCLRISLKDRPSSPSRMRKRYFGHQIIWYLHCHTACANLLNCFTEYLPLPLRVTTLKLMEVFFLCKSLSYPLSKAWTISAADGLRN